MLQGLKRGDADAVDKALREDIGDAYDVLFGLL
jgi:hypothetical protein